MSLDYCRRCSRCTQLGSDGLCDDCAHPDDRREQEEAREVTDRDEDPSEVTDRDLERAP